MLATTKKGITRSPVASGMTALARTFENALRAAERDEQKEAA
jgi:hypothetical protein